MLWTEASPKLISIPQIWGNFLMLFSRLSPEGVLTLAFTLPITASSNLVFSPPLLASLTPEEALLPLLLPLRVP